jgi:hypothetical protein
VTAITVTIAYLRYHWADRYVFSQEDGQWVATAKFAAKDRLAADTPQLLLDLVREHYRPPAIDLGTT